MTQTISTDVANQLGMSNTDPAALWTEATLSYPVYAALAAQFNLAPLHYPAGELPPSQPTRDVFDRDLQWLDAIDERLLAYQLRQVPSEIFNQSEPSLRAFIQRQLRKPNKSMVDRDKIDWLITQYFALCVPEELYREEIKLDDVARVLHPVIAADATSPECCAPLEKILADIERFHSFRDFLENGILEQGRLLKDAAGASFYDPAALVAFCRFNFLLRRAFIRLLHTDLKVMAEAIDALEARGKKTVDCRRAGFSAAETTSRLRYFCANWKQPFQKDYTESSVSRSLEQLLALRADLEEALGRARSSESQSIHASGAHTASPLPSSPDGSPPSAGNDATTSASGRHSAAAPANPEQCLKAISAQVNAGPAARGSSMFTVVLQDTKVLLSAWEVAAFVAETSPESADLQRAVVARALLALAMDQRKRSGEESALASALALARNDVSCLQVRVEDAKQTKNTEAAINLGISTKRLASFIEEAEKLQP